MSDTFKALVLTQEDGKTVSSIKQLSNDDLPEGDVLLAVDYSSLNYKDGLAITGKGKIVRQWPLVPGIDPPRELLDIEPSRVFGLTLDPATLVAIRRARLRSLPSLNRLAYADPETVATELRWALRFFRSRGWRSVDISGKAVEENASRILELLAAGVQHHHQHHRHGQHGYCLHTVGPDVQAGAAKEDVAEGKDHDHQQRRQGIDKPWPDIDRPASATHQQHVRSMRIM